MKSAVQDDTELQIDTSLLSIPSLGEQSISKTLPLFWGEHSSLLPEDIEHSSLVCQFRLLKKRMLN